MDLPPAFEGTAFLGLARRAPRDAYRLELFAEHLESGERVLALLPVRGGTLLATDRRLLELQAHLDVHGAWNVREFHGYAVRRAWPRGAIRGLAHAAGPTPSAAGIVEDRLVLTMDDGEEAVVVSRGPEPTLGDADVAALRGAVLGAQPK